MGFILGLLLGVIGGLLYAPKAGDQTREEWRQRSDELRRRGEELQRVATKMAGDASARGREIVDDAKRQWDRSGTGTGPGTGGGSAS